MRSTGQQKKWKRKEVEDMREQIAANMFGKKSEIIKAIAFVLILSFVVVLPAYAAPEWKKQGTGNNPQGDQRKTGKTDGSGDVPVYGAIGNLDNNRSMDIDGDGTPDITLPEADIIEVSVCPSVLVNLHRDEEIPENLGMGIVGVPEKISSTSAKGTIQNQNSHNKLTVSMAALEPQDANAKAVTVTDELDSHANNGLSLSLYADNEASNAFAKSSGSIGSQVLSLANTAANPPVALTLGILSEKGTTLQGGSYRFKADCRSAFVDRYKDKSLKYKAIFKFTIKK